jgi:hypothetical protein
MRGLDPRIHDEALRMRALPLVVTGLVPVTPLRQARCPLKRDGRVKPGHDNVEIGREIKNLCSNGRKPRRLNDFSSQQITYPHRSGRAYIPHVLLNEGAI